ncbi:MAG: AtpZ/AtpI family protein [Dehalococcoidia bacterium]|nr:AtpZ/AtpI family protein [Dehalococcoidia bacterium]
MHKANRPPGEEPKLVRQIDILRLLGFGWYFGACVIGGTLGGYFLDRWLGTKPGFTLGGLLLGGAAGFYGMFKMLLPLYQGERLDDKDK